jgi:hypothetical protein
LKKKYCGLLTQWRQSAGFVAQAELLYGRAIDVSGGQCAECMYNLANLLAERDAVAEAIGLYRSAIGTSLFCSSAVSGLTAVKMFDPATLQRG